MHFDHQAKFLRQSKSLQGYFLTKILYYANIFFIEKMEWIMSACISVGNITTYNDKFNCRHLTLTDTITTEVLCNEVAAARTAGIHVLTIKFIPELGQIISEAQAAGFTMHHGNAHEVQMIRCLQNHHDSSCSFPPYKTLSVGITMVIFNSQLDKIAAVIEKLGSSNGWKAITGSVDYGNGLAETPLEAAVREAREEVGLSLNLEDVVYCGRLWTSNFRGVCPDLNEVYATVLSSEDPLKAQESELNAARWISIDEIISTKPESVDSRVIIAAKNAILNNAAYNASRAYWSWDKQFSKPIEFISLSGEGK